MSTTISSHAAPTLDRVLAFLRAGVARTADAFRPIDAGWVVSSQSLPAVWSVNQLRVSEPLSFAALVALADEQLASLPYRHVVAEHQLAGPGLEDAFRTNGWKVERHLTMVLSAAPDSAADTAAVVEAEEDEVLELMSRWLEDGSVSGPAELAQLVDYSRREARVLGDRLLGVRSGGGQLVAIAKLRSDGAAAQVEDVYTVPEARGCGFARALVSRAIELARVDGRELIFIVADDEDWPKLLYRRLGFRPLGWIWQFHRDD